MKNAKEWIESGKAVLGIELGSTRIKAVLVDGNHKPLASGAHNWENQLINGIWTYSLDAIWNGVQNCYQNLIKNVREIYGVNIKKLAAIGISGMMHGYMPFDSEGNLLVPFRTWRNTITGEAAGVLTKEFSYHIPQRWSIAHLYQAILNGEEHVGQIAYFTTLAGYIHWKLTGERVLGVGDASGMFPIDPKTKNYNARMIQQFDVLPEVGKYPWKLEKLLPKVLVAGEVAGVLTSEGAKLLDISGNLEAGILLCPPESDAGTGMVASNSVAVRTGSVSAGTSVFVVVVLEEELKALHEELDMVTTPSGETVVMAECNNCTSDINAWVNLFAELMENLGMEVDKDLLFGILYKKALEGDKDCGGLMAYNYLSGEHVVGLNEGRPLFLRKPNANFTLANFMRTHLYASLATLKIGCDILFKEEKIKMDRIIGHGGFFKTQGVGQSILAAVMNVPVTVMETAGEGGAWGIALLASYMVNGKAEETLEYYLKEYVFDGEGGTTIAPNPKDVAGFEAFLEIYRNVLVVEKMAVDTITVN